jgi:hypothetical protein
VVSRIPSTADDEDVSDRLTDILLPSYISPPPQLLGDLQDASEYFVNAVHRLTDTSGKKVPVITWSVGGLVAQWSATFYPSIRTLIDRKVGFAPDYRGTIEGEQPNAYIIRLLKCSHLSSCTAYLLEVADYIEPSIWQQATFSHFILTLANAGGLSTSYAPTTTIYSDNDEIVEPETPNQIASSYLSTSSNFLVQDTCGPAFIMEHSQELFNNFTYKIAKAALASSTGVAPPNAVTAADCTELPPPQLTPADVAYDLTIIPQAGLAIIVQPKVNCEPPIRGYAKKYDPVIATGGICFNNPPQSKTYAQAKGFTAPLSLAQIGAYLVGSNATTAEIKKAISSQ